MVILLGKVIQLVMVILVVMVIQLDTQYCCCFSN